MIFSTQEAVTIPNKDILSWTFDDVKYDLDTPIYIDALEPSHKISAREVKKMVRNLVAGFRAVGLNKGDCIYLPIIFLGIIGAGGVYSGRSVGMTRDELRRHGSFTKSKIFITVLELLEDTLFVARECGVSMSNVWVLNIGSQKAPEGYKSWQELLKYGEADWIKFDDEKISKSTEVCRVQSSGTTGPPKAVMLSHYNFIAQHTLTCEREYNKNYKIVRLVHLLMFHIASILWSFIAPLKANITCYILPRFEVEQFLCSIAKHRITDIIVTPAAIGPILASSELSCQYSLSSLRNARYGSTAISMATLESFRKLLGPNCCLYQTWGMTELCMMATLLRWPEEDRTGTVGRLIPTLSAKLIDDNGKDITAYGTIGELCLKGPTIFLGYFNNKEETDASFDKEGWFKTGDIMYCKNDLWYFVSRKKELLKVNGVQVSPSELEEVLNRHPGIAESAVIGVTPPWNNGVEAPRAYIVREKKYYVNEDVVLQYFAEHLSPYKQLVGGIKFVDFLPKTVPLGKLAKATLKKQAELEMKDEKPPLNLSALKISKQ